MTTPANDVAPRGELLEAVVRSSLDCIIVIDDARRVVVWNPATEVVFGRARADVLGLALSELIVPPRHRWPHAAGMTRYLATGTAKMLGRRVRSKSLRADGSEFPVESTSPQPHAHATWQPGPAAR